MQCVGVRQITASFRKSLRRRAIAKNLTQYRFQVAPLQRL